MRLQAGSIKEVELRLSPSDLDNTELILFKIRKKLKLGDSADFHFEITRKSIDARKSPVYVLRCRVSKDPFAEERSRAIQPQVINEKSKTCLIVGAGPAGYFAALELLAQGIKPVVLERGKDVRRRRRDLRAIQQEGTVNPHSNYCYGEGGAGTYSDGKLYTRSQKRGRIIDILETLVEHGAPTDILIDAHPHIGSNKLPNIVSAIRESIEKNGGEVLFDHCVTDFIIKEGDIIGLETEEGKSFHADGVILATGHSARDIFKLCDKHDLLLEKKDFALGVRIEHPQALIDKIQYGMKPRPESLPASSYGLACQIEEKGVFSFCMCPGGLIVPAATSPGEIVVNGMSLSRRDSPYSNSGFVTAINQDEMEERGYKGLFAHLDFQAKLEQEFYKAGDGSQAAPAQRVTDFNKGKLSDNLGDSSYIPGIYAAPLHELLPDFIVDRMRKALRIFDQKMKGYYTEEAQMIGLESRTSSPIRIPREKETGMHRDLKGFFPCGEGAGYAGGILSAAMDGRNVARKVKEYLDA